MPPLIRLLDERANQTWFPVQFGLLLHLGCIAALFQGRRSCSAAGGASAPDYLELSDRTYFYSDCPQLVTDSSCSDGSSDAVIIAIRDADRDQLADLYLRG